MFGKKKDEKNNSKNFLSINEALLYLITKIKDFFIT